MKDTLKNDLTKHLKAGNKLEVTTLRNILGEINTREKGGKAPIELDRPAIENLLRKESTRRRETATTYRNAGHPDRAAQETAEADFIDSYLPTMLTESEATQILDTVMSSLFQGSTPTMRDMGKIMKELNTKVAGRFDGKTLSDMVRARLSR